MVDGIICAREIQREERCDVAVLLLVLNLVSENFETVGCSAKFAEAKMTIGEKVLSFSKEI